MQVVSVSRAALSLSPCKHYPPSTRRETLVQPRVTACPVPLRFARGTGEVPETRDAGRGASVAVTDVSVTTTGSTIDRILCVVESSLCVAAPACAPAGAGCGRAEDPEDRDRGNDVDGDGLSIDHHHQRSSSSSSSGVPPTGGVGAVSASSVGVGVGAGAGNISDGDCDGCAVTDGAAVGVTVAGTVAINKEAFQRPEPSPLSSSYSRPVRARKSPEHINSSSRSGEGGSPCDTREAGSEAKSTHCTAPAPSAAAAAASLFALSGAQLEQAVGVAMSGISDALSGARLRWRDVSHLRVYYSVGLSGDRWSGDHAFNNAEGERLHARGETGTTLRARCEDDVKTIAKPCGGTPVGNREELLKRAAFLALAARTRERPAVTFVPVSGLAVGAVVSVHATAVNLDRLRTEMWVRGAA